MKIIKDCNKCKKDYMYDPNTEPQFAEFCQDCVEQEKESLTDPKNRLEEIIENYEEKVIKNVKAWMEHRNLFSEMTENLVYEKNQTTNEILKELVHKDNIKDICLHGKRIGHQYCRECSLKIIEEEYNLEKESFDQRAKDRGYVHKDKLPSIEEIENLLKTPKLAIKKLMSSTLDEFLTKIIKDGIKIDFRTIAKAIRKLIEGK